MRRLRPHSIPKYLQQGLLLGVFSALLIYGASTLSWLDGLERGALDALYHLRGRRYPSNKIVIVVADDQTVAHFGRWPLKRGVYAELVRRLTRAGARTIAFDVIFSASSDHPAEDREFARACQASGRVVQAAVFSVPLRYTTVATVQNSLPGKVTLPPARFSLTERDAYARDAVSGGTSMPALLDSAVAIGHLTVYPEWDGALRRIPHIIRFKGAPYPSLALAAAAHFTGLAPHDIAAIGSEVHLAGHRIPLEPSGETLVNWVGPRTFPTYTFLELLNTDRPLIKGGHYLLSDDLLKESVKDCVVLVGITAPGAYEYHATPFSPNEPAVELQANALDDILMDRPLSETPVWVQLALLFGLALAAGVWTARHGARGTALRLLAIAIMLWLAAILLMAKANLYLPPAAPILAALLTCALSLGYRQIRDARELRIAEERYALAVRGANDGLWDWNLQTNEVYYSPRWKTMLGLEEKTETGSQKAESLDGIDEWFERVHPEDLPALKAEIARHIEGTLPHFESEHRILHRDGGYRWALSRGLRVLDEAGKPARMAGSMTDITQKREAAEQLLRNAFYDGLTGLPNRALFMDRLGRTIAHAKRHENYLFAVLFLDVDRFKVVNDSLGHMLGDRLLVAIAQRIESCLRPGDTAARLGGDEFTVLLDDIAHISDATRVAERIQVALSLPLSLNGHEVFPTASIGIAVGTTAAGQPRYEQADDLLRDADTAMYRAKALGRARHEVFDEAMHARVVALLRLETDLRRALERQNFQVHYQPIISLKTGRLHGFEALARWQHPERGLVPPAEFIGLAEETGLIIPIDQWILREACSQTCIWQERFGSRFLVPETVGRQASSDLTISVNLSSKHFSQPNLAEQIESVLCEVGLNPHCLRLEVTESVIMENSDSAALILAQLKALGIQLSIDDFGTGYSSLSYLHHFPLDILKVDRSFVKRIGAQGEDSEIVQAIITLARNMKMDVVAEGIETPEQLAQLRALGCDYGQGYLFARPLNSEAATVLLHEDPQW